MCVLNLDNPGLPIDDPYAPRYYPPEVSADIKRPVEQTAPALNYVIDFNEDDLIIYL